MSTSAYRIHWLRLRLDDYLWFASLEWGNDNETSAVIHGYALSFALSGRERAFAFGGVPTYEEDLAAVDVYATPARLADGPRHRGIRSVLTFNSIDNPTLLTAVPRIAEGKSNDPKFGRRQVLLPGVRFELVAFTRGQATLPRVFRLGKKRSPVVVEESREVRGTAFRGNAEPSHAINPLDVSGIVTECVLHSIPPHLVYERAAIEDDEFVRDGKLVVHIPERVRRWDPTEASGGGLWRSP
jgi:CRISPR type I-D-associated protein Csc1